jgi:beta-glucanase (GH16 family)
MKLKLTALLVMIAFLSGCGDDEPGGGELSQLSIFDVAVIEESGEATVNLRLSSESVDQVTVTYNTVDGTATAGEDYTVAENATISFAPGETSKDIVISITDDEDAEFDETFDVVLSNPENVIIADNTGTVTIVNRDEGDPFNQTIPEEGYETPESYEGMTLVWRDEFDELNLEDWTFEIGTGSNGWGNNELQYYREENTSILDGHLVIEARRESFGGRAYTSSRMITQNKQTFQYGRIDIRAALPEGQGLWPALWMLGSNFSTVGWPDCGEIDIMEMIGGSGRESTVHGTVHWDNNGSYASFGGERTVTGPTLHEAFHVYTIIWDANQIRWLIDDVQYHVIDITPAALSEFRQDYFFIFNVAVGGNWPGSPDGTTMFPQRMYVDYVRVFQDN